MHEFGLILSQILDSWGPWALFVLAILETSFVTGLVVPSGTAAAFAAAVSRDDPATLAVITLATAAGGWVGDLLGYLIGSWTGPRLLESRGWVGSVLRKHQATAGRFLGRRPVYSVTLARLVSFVRTIMPLSAGMSGMKPLPYLVFELPGVLLWAVLYVGIGILAGESWQLVSSLVGAGWMVLFGAVGFVIWLRARASRSGAKS
jgi:membrane protein DedA with SNARE-associated domain